MAIGLFMDNAKNKPQIFSFALDDHDWQLLAGTESVLQSLDVLAMASQKESTTSNVFAFYYVAMSRASIKNINTLSVIDLDKSWNPDMQVSDIPRKDIDKGDF